MTPSNCQHPIPPADLLGYFERRLTPDQEGFVESHLAKCGYCACRAWQAHTFATLSPSWTAAAHGRAYREAKQIASPLVALIGALKIATHRWRDYASQFGVWTRLATKALKSAAIAPEQEIGSLWRYVAETIDREGREIGAGLFLLSGSSTESSFALDGSDPRRGPYTTGAERVRTRGGTVIGSSPARRRPGASVPILSIQRIGSPAEGVVLRAERGSHVRTRGGARFRLVLMIPVREGPPLRLEKLQWNEKEKRFVGELIGVEPSDYVFALEPPDQI